jgi:Txe/YoeB family toxin of Txe-Axe toxin-antitoxin module
MIIRLVIILLISGIVSSCHNKELEILKKENRQLKNELLQRENDINQFIQVFNDVEDNLAEIRNRENLIVKNSASSENTDMVANVKDDIRAIDQLMKQNKERLSSLAERLKSSTGENNQLQRMISNFELMMKNKDREIVDLIEKLENLNYDVQDLYSSVTNLQLANIEKEQTIDRQTREMNKAWYIIASAKQLKSLGIIEKKGGFLGLGKVNTLSGDIDVSNFKEIDLREITVFSLDAKKVSLLSSHPDDAWLIRKDENEKRIVSFEITRPEVFWNTSRSMVLVVD